MATHQPIRLDTSGTRSSCAWALWRFWCFVNRCLACTRPTVIRAGFSPPTTTRWRRYSSRQCPRSTRCGPCLRGSRHRWCCPQLLQSPPLPRESARRPQMAPAPARGRSRSPRSATAPRRWKPGPPPPRPPRRRCARRWVRLRRRPNQRERRRGGTSRRTRCSCWRRSSRRTIPQRRERRTIAADLKVKPRQVQTWFQNKRQRLQAADPGNEQGNA